MMIMIKISQLAHEKNVRKNPFNKTYAPDCFKVDDAIQKCFRLDM